LLQFALYFHAAAYNLAAIIALTYLGNILCRVLFRWTGLKDSTAETGPDGAKAGRIIGIFERLIIAAGIMVHSWEVLAAVIALKTVARFQKMDQREFAEYFLVGSLFSIFWALIIVTLWLIYDRHVGLNIGQVVIDLLTGQPALSPTVTNP
jgi:NADH:ubiquinone oxidoreductase subunit 6 (subunit J)